MNKKLFVITTLLVSLYLTGCANNGNDNNFANRPANNRGTTNVNYSPNPVGPYIRDQNMNRNNNITNVRNDNRNNMRVADKAADRVVALPEVDHANVIVTNNNAYVAAKLDRSSRNELTSDIEDKISREVKSVDRDIDNVYVSVNPDFYDRMNTYAGDIRNGRPVSGFFDQFTDTIRRVFPNAR